MRRANDSKFIIHNGEMLGINLGADFTSEHEWGIKGIKELFGIPSGDKDFGLKRRMITTVPPDHAFGWTEGYEKGSGGLYLWDTWNNRIPSFSDITELRTYKGTLACAWDENSFGVFSSDPKELATLQEIYESFRHKDGAIFLGGGGVFQNAGLCLVIVSRLPQEFLDGWYKADKEYYDMDQEVEKTGIRQLLKEKGKRYFALSSPHHRKEDGKLELWLNPMEQNANNFGWFTIDDLKEWAEGKGKIPKTEGAKK